MKDAADDSHTGFSVPGLRTWRGVYAFVIAAFVVCIVGLTALEKLFP